MRISSLLGGAHPTVSFEFFPPKTDVGRQSLVNVAGRLAPLAPDYVSVTYGAGGATRSLTLDTCLSMKGHISADVMAHLTCVCHTEEEIARVADELWDTGIENIMALRGDRPRDRQDDNVFIDFQYGSDLIAFLKTRHDFCCGGGCYPEGHSETPDLEVGIDHLKKKIDAGCDFLVTQMFFDNEYFYRFRDKARKAGINVPVIPGIMPITGVAQLDKFENQFKVMLPAQLHEMVGAGETSEGNIEEVGVAWAAKQCKELLDEGAPGIHFYTLNKSVATVKVCGAIGLVGTQGHAVD